jgi:fructokinase
MIDARLAGLEAGGTKFICAVANDARELLGRIEIPTTTPNETLSAVFEFFHRHHVKAFGVGSFGPLQLEPGSDEYGTIVNSPKSAWTGTNIMRELARNLAVPGGTDTDVNCAARAELRYGSPDLAQRLIYITVGTGVGVGWANRSGDAIQSDAGHMLVPSSTRVRGACRFHVSCLEGVASGPALQLRYGVPPAELLDEEAWTEEARYLAAAVCNLHLMAHPDRLVMGGGVMRHSGLVERVNSVAQQWSNGYPFRINPLVESPTLGENSGVVGALLLAEQAWASALPPDASG